jgi:polysaccharide pyruvyl transferase WcaK-like protein/O-antigen/teichoic acid export membrane protein
MNSAMKTKVEEDVNTTNSSNTVSNEKEKSAITSHNGIDQDVTIAKVASNGIALLEEGSRDKGNNNNPSPIAYANHSRQLNKVIAPGILLIIDQLLVAAGGWFYWLIISKLTSPSEIGMATAIYSLVMLATTASQLGLEYPLLKRSSSPEGSKILGTVIILEMVLGVISIPVVFFAATIMYGQESTGEYLWLTAGILILTSLGFVFRFALLGVSDAKSVLVFDIIGTVLKFATGYLLVAQGYGAFGILLSFVAYNAIVAAGTLVIAKRRLEFRLDSILFAKEIIKDGLANMPSKLSKTFVMNLSVVLLASIGAMSNSQVGIFYIELMISVAAGSVASSIAYMIIPASASEISKTSSAIAAGGIRIAFSLTAILVIALLADPTFVLSLLGPNYASEATSFFMLSLSIVPSAILNASVSRLNASSRLRELVTVGSVQIVIFALTFFTMSPLYGITGAAISILVSSSVAAIMSLAWYHERSYIRSIVLTSFAILCGWLVGYGLELLVPLKSPIIIISSSVATTVALLFATKSISLADIQVIFKAGSTKITKTPDTHRNIGLSSITLEGGLTTKKIHCLMLGNYGNFNIGDEMLLRAAMRDIIRNNSSNKNSVSFQIPTRNPSFVTTYHKTDSHCMIPLPINKPLKLLKAFSDSNVIVVGGGGIWSGYTGPLAHFIPVITIAGKLMNKKVQFNAIGLYSTASSIDKILVNLAILLSDSSSVRDKESFQLLWKLNRWKKKATLVDDLALQYLRQVSSDEILELERQAIQSGAEKTSFLLSSQKNEKKKILIGISVKPVNKDEINEKIINAFSTAINILNLKYPDKLLFVFFPFAKTNSVIESDEKLTNVIRGRLSRVDNNSTIVFEHSDPLLWYIAIKKHIDIFVGMRFHSIIFASQAVKPVVCIPYERKITEFLKGKQKDPNISVVLPEDLGSFRIISIIEAHIEKILGRTEQHVSR